MQWSVDITLLLSTHGLRKPRIQAVTSIFYFRKTFIDRLVQLYKYSKGSVSATKKNVSTCLKPNQDSPLQILPKYLSRTLESCQCIKHHKATHSTNMMLSTRPHSLRLPGPGAFLKNPTELFHPAAELHNSVSSFCGEECKIHALTSLPHHSSPSSSS